MRVLVSSEDDDRTGLRLLKQIAGVDVVPYDPNGRHLSDAQQASHVLIPPYRSSHRPIPLLAQLPQLRMVQLLTAGADEWSPSVPADVLLATSRGAHAGPVSEWVLSAILTLYRQWPDLVRYQDRRTWAHRKVSPETLRDKRVLIVGAGAIGTAVSDRVRAFDAVATLVARTARDDVHAACDLPTLIGEHDIVVIAAPLTETTKGLVDNVFLARMRTDSVLVNAARGQIVDTDALVTELRSERIRAALDVTEPEPLPADHPLWACPGVIISPHMARTVPGTPELCYSIAAEQVGMLISGQTPSNLVTER